MDCSAKLMCYAPAAWYLPLSTGRVQEQSIMEHKAIGLAHAVNGCLKGNYGFNEENDLTWWLQFGFLFTPNLGKIPILTSIFEMG